MRPIYCTRMPLPLPCAHSAYSRPRLSGFSLAFLTLRVYSTSVLDPTHEEGTVAAWVLRGGRNGEREDAMLDEGVLTVGFGHVDDLSDMQRREAFLQLIREAMPDASPRRAGIYAGNLHRFRELIEEGDVVVMPRKHMSVVAIGVVVGGYVYRPGRGEFSHGRPVNWLNTGVPKDSLDADLRRSLFTTTTVFRLRQDNAGSRLQALATGRPVSGDVGSGTEPEPDALYDETPLDVQEYARSQIREHVERNFHGHDLSALVAAVLVARGYRVTVSSPGPDGGVDILAGMGAMGFDPPRVCVQVKSGRQPVGVGVLRELQGVMQTFKADHGMLVSWGGFARPAEQEARALYFNVRLWDSENLLDAILDNYDRLPPDVTSALPLKRFWALIQDSDG